MSRSMLTMGALIMGVVTTIHAAETGKKVDPTRMTCEEFVALSVEAKPRVVAWLEGYSEAGKAVREEVVAVPVEPDVATVVASCTETPKQSLWDKIRAKLPFSKKTVSDPTKMTCDEFVGLGKEIQPVVAYWLDGYTEGGGSGKTKGAKAGNAETAAVPALVVDRDVLVVVDECRAAPKESLWDKIKKKFRGA
jgi:acid stress chaperone HdeA